MVIETISYCTSRKYEDVEVSYESSCSTFCGMVLSYATCILCSVVCRMPCSRFLAPVCCLGCGTSGDIIYEFMHLSAHASALKYVSA